MSTCVTSFIFRSINTTNDDHENVYHAIQIYIFTYDVQSRCKFYSFVRFVYFTLVYPLGFCSNRKLVPIQLCHNAADIQPTCIQIFSNAIDRMHTNFKLVARLICLTSRLNASAHNFTWKKYDSFGCANCTMLWLHVHCAVHHIYVVAVKRTCVHVHLKIVLKSVIMRWYNKIIIIIIRQFKMHLHTDPDPSSRFQPIEMECRVPNAECMANGTYVPNECTHSTRVHSTHTTDTNLR